jgi:hypothetical protein
VAVDKMDSPAIGVAHRQASLLPGEFEPQRANELLVIAASGEEKAAAKQPGDRERLLIS